MFATVAVVASTGGQADAAQCGDGSGGFESWKREFDEEATTKGVGATAVAALMQANYASATIAADRSQRSFGLSLDQFLAKRGALLTHLGHQPALRKNSTLSRAHRGLLLSERSVCS
jgi:membrane-bound lytic murein transglycosylase B